MWMIIAFLVAATDSEDGTFTIARDAEFSTQVECRVALRESVTRIGTVLSARPSGSEEPSIFAACVYKGDTLKVQYK
jgi:hypothetical protein